MAETPFQPGSGAADAASPSDPGGQGSPEPVAPAPAPGSEPAPVEVGVPAWEPAPAPEPSVVVEQTGMDGAEPPPAPPEPVAPSTPEVPAAAVEPTSFAVPEPPAPAAPEQAGMAPEPVTAPGSPSALPEPESEPAAEPPGVAATIEVPPLEGAGPQEGGEWEMLLNRLTTWWNSGELGRQWQRIRGPLKGVAILVVVLVALRAYATVVSTIDAIPLVSGLLELAGLITVLQFGTTRLLRSSDREQVLAQWRRRWLDFRGRD
jgi:hypothetical protein